MSIVPARAAWADVNEEDGDGESIRPEPRGHVGVEEQRADVVIKSANDTLGSAILLGCVRTSEAKDGAVRSEEVTDGDVVKLFPIVSL